MRLGRQHADDAKGDQNDRYGDQEYLALGRNAVEPAWLIGHG